MTAKLISLLTRHCSLRISALVALLLIWQLPTALAETPPQTPSLSSDTEKVTVAHHPPYRAFMFFVGLGMVVLVATLPLERSAERERDDRH